MSKIRPYNPSEHLQPDIRHQAFINKFFIQNFRYLLISWFCIFVLFVTGLSQTGIPYYTNFRLPEGISKQNRSIAQDPSGNLLFANNQGLLRFDGSHWEYLLQDLVPYALVNDPQTGELFLSTETGFGILKQTSNGNFDYLQLYEIHNDQDPVTTISFQNDLVIFYSDECIYKYHKTSSTIDEVRSETGSLFSGYFLFKDQLYVNVKERGLFLSKNNLLVPIQDGKLFDNVSILFFLKMNDNQSLLVTDNSLIYKYDGHNFSDFIPQDDAYLSNAVITKGLMISESEIALGTLSGGCIFLNVKTGKTKFILNYQSGLPDDEIYTMYLDQNKGIWVSHEFGATRIDPNLPVRTYNPLKGLEGNLSEAILFKNQLYVSTSLGVFYFHKVKRYKETEILINQPSKSLTPIKKLEKKVEVPLNQPNRSPSIPTSEKSSNEKKKGFLAKIFKTGKRPINKANDKSVYVEAFPKVTQEEVIPPIHNKTQEKKVTRYRIKKQAKLISESWEFSKVSGLNAKCGQMLTFKDRLFIASNTGLYEIKGNKNQMIINYAYVNHLYISPSVPGRMYVGTESGLDVVDFNDSTYHVNHNFIALDRPVFSILEESGNLWLGSDSRVIRLPLNVGRKVRKPVTYLLPIHYSEKVIVEKVNTQVGFFIPSGVFAFNNNSGEILSIDSLKPANGRLNQYLFAGNGKVFRKAGNEWKDLSSNKPGDVISPYLNLFNDIRFLRPDPDNNLWVIDGDNHLNKILLGKQLYTEKNFTLNIKSFIGSKNNFTGETSFSIFPGEQPLKIDLSAPFYIRPDLTEYQFLLSGVGPNWSEWAINQKINLPFMSPGNHVLRVRARNALGFQSNEKYFSINVLPSFTNSVYFYVLLVLGIVSIIFLVVVIRERKLIHDKKVLEQNVKVRTHEIEKQKEQIENQKDRIEKQRDELAFRKQEITDSIDYGKRIQHAVLPPAETFKKLLGDYFIYYRPRDIVSGDFYWVHEKKGKIAIAIADCTGHGVPGAFMSFLGYSILTEIANNDSLTNAGKILDQLRLKLKIALHQTKENQEMGDGMDMALCILDLKKYTCQFAGAYNSLCLVRDKTFKEFHGDKMPIGMHLMDHIAFTNHRIQLRQGDLLYLFTDGYSDQFGGPKEKKFKIGPFHDLILQISELDMKEQEKRLDEKLKEWMGNADQVDDILIMGIKITSM